MAFLRREDASIEHHTPSIILFICSASRATTPLNNATGLGSPVKYLVQSGAHIISQNQPNRGSGTWPLWYHTPATSQFTSTGHFASIYAHKCHSITSGIATSQDTRLPELCRSDIGIETAVRRSTSTYSNVIVRLQAILGSRPLLFVVQPRRTQLQEREPMNTSYYNV